MPVSILLDEHFAPELAYRLAEHGFDVVCARDRGLLGRQDWELMPWRIRQQRAICTMNRRHFEREHERCRQRGEDHYGVLVVEDWLPEDIYWALRQYLESDPDPLFLVNQIVKLPRASPGFVRERSPASE